MAGIVTFGLALVAYTLVCASVILHAWGWGTRPTSVSAAVTALIHVGLVWGLRFGWSLDVAVEKGWAGFVIFHLALAGIVASALVPRPWSGRVIVATFPVVTAGALGAAFKYEFVAVYRIPLVVAAALVVTLAMLRGVLRAVQGTRER